jgi:hypothetical protein
LGCHARTCAPAVLIRAGERHPLQRMMERASEQAQRYARNLPPAGLSAAEVAARFVKADKARMAELLATLASLGQAGEEAGRYGAV